MKIRIPNKKIQIDKAQSNTLIVLAVATFVSVFSLLSAKHLWSEAGFQRHVINARRASAEALQKDVQSAKLLTTNYADVFTSPNRADNVLGGRNSTSPNASPPDGDNARIILDALPTNYDFPALISSLTKILSNDGIVTPGISGNDQTATVNDSPTSNPAPVAINLSVNATGSLSAVTKVIQDLERSIRPFDITNLQLSGSNNNMSLSLNLKTYFQPPKSLTIGTKEVQ